MILSTHAYQVLFDNLLSIISRDEQKPNRKLKPHQKPQKPHETAPNKTAPNKNRTETKPHRSFGFGFGF